MVVQVALIGTACTGKTMVLEMLPDLLVLPCESVRYMPELARDLISARRDISPTDAEFQITLFEKEIGRLKSLSGESLVITDRCLLDPIVYLRALKKHDIARELARTHRDLLLGIDRYLLFDPSGVPYRDDEQRKDGAEFRTQVHDEFVRALNEMGLDWRLVSGTPDQRAQSVVDSLNDVAPERVVQSVSRVQNAGSLRHGD